MAISLRTTILGAGTLGAATALLLNRLAGHPLGDWAAPAVVALVAAAAAAIGTEWQRRIRRRIREWAAAEPSGTAPPLETGWADLDGLAAIAVRRLRELSARHEETLIALSEWVAALDAMNEGVLVIDGAGTVRRINRAARDLLAVGSAPCEGRPVLEVVRNAELNRMIRRTLRSGEATEAEIKLPGPREMILQAASAPLPRSLTGPSAGGALVVLQDLTRVRALERVRRDFVANASHELRTPVTAIRGFAESLQECALPADAAELVEAIVRNSSRLELLIRDLLTLAEIESEQEQGRTPVKENLPVDVVFAAVEDICGPAARNKRISLRFVAPPGLRVWAVPSLLERALANLVENAVRYSETGTRVEVIAEERGPEILFHVRDQGPGIPAEHLDRIFERFYRIDRARSRRQGGTGLGLAIVRHAIEAQGGSVSVESTVGRGSTFTLHLPREVASPATSG